MKNLLASLFIISVFALCGCQSHKEQALNRIKTLTVQLDSLDGVFQNIDWQHWRGLSDTINNNIAVIGAHSDLALKLDPSFTTYWRPYSTSGKLLSRVFRKTKREIQDELHFSKGQLENLEKDIKLKAIDDTDSITIYIGQEQNAIEELIFQVTTLEKTLYHQQVTYDSTYNQVDALAKKLKMSNPSIGVGNKDIHYEEDQEQD
jgi:uncharacterized coiled-coil protein SlyX